MMYFCQFLLRKWWSVLIMLPLFGEMVSAETDQAQLVRKDSALSLSTQASGDVLQGKRLFFERTDHKKSDSADSSAQKVVAATQLLGNQVSNAELSGDADKSIDEHAQVPRRQRLHYQAYIESRDAITIIINGHVCTRLVHGTGQQVTTAGIDIDCPLLKLAGGKLTLFAEKKTLQLDNGRESLKIARPGQWL